MTPPDGDGAPYRRAAARRLGLPADVTPDAARAGLLDCLLEHDFLPDPATHEAILILAGRPVGEPAHLADALESEAEALADEIDGFAAEFFLLPPDDRRRRWEALLEASAGHPSLRIRLRALEPGLAIDRSAFADPSPTVTRLADDLFELFVMAPDPRAVRTRELTDRLRADPALNERALRRAMEALSGRHPEIAALSRGYLERLAQSRKPRKPPRSIRRPRRDLIQVIASRGPWFVLGYIFVCFVIFAITNISSWSYPVARPEPRLTQPSALPLDQLLRKGKRTPSPVFAQYFRSSFREPIRREVAK